MNNDEPKLSETLQLDEPNAVSGGTVFSAPRGDGSERCEVYCPKCGSGDIDGINKLEFSTTAAAESFLNNTTATCRKCGFSARTLRFKRHLA